MSGLERVTLRGEEKRFYEAARDGRLIYARCTECGHTAIHPRWRCTACGSGSTEERVSEGRGEVWSVTTLERSPDPDLQAPYQVAIVKLAEGFTMMCRIAGDEVAIGQGIEIAFEPSGELAYPIARPVP